MARPPRRGKPKDSGRKPKKKVSILNQEKVEYIDWKDVNLLRRFTSDRAKIRARRVTGNDVRQQKAIALAIKSARDMALLPYTNRVTTHRSSRGERGERGERSERGESTSNEEEFEGMDDIEEVDVDVADDSEFVEVEA